MVRKLNAIEEEDARIAAQVSANQTADSNDKE